MQNEPNEFHNDLNIRPLSPADWIMAVIAGAIGGPAGMVLSPAVLYGLSKFSGKAQRWILWSLIGLVGVPASWTIAIWAMHLITVSSPDAVRQESGIIQSQEL